MQRPLEFVRNAMESRARRAWGGVASVLILGATVLLGTLLAAPVAAQQMVDADARQLGLEVEERFDVMVLRYGLLLSPREEEEGLAGIEISDEGVALDGRLVDESELRARLDDVEAELVLSLQILEQEVRRAIFSPEEVQPIVESPMEGDPEPDEDDVVVVEEEAAAAIAAGRAERDEKRAERSKHRRRSHSDSKVVVGERVVVDADESYGEVVVFGNDLVVLGEVRGDAVAIGGSVRVDGGEVMGEVSAIGGSIELENGAVVAGGAVSVGGSVEVADDVEIRGDVVEVPFAPSFHFGNWGSGGWDRGQWDGDNDFLDFSPFRMVTRVAWKVFGLVLLALMACLVMLLAKNPMARVERRVVAEPWKSGLVGLVAQVLFVPFLVLVVVVLAISIIGIPLLLLVPFAVLALVVVAFLGYTAVAHRVGKLFESRVGWKLDSPYLVLIVGVLLIEAFCLVGDLLDFGWVWFFAAMFTMIGVLIEYVVWTVGFGAALLTRFGTSEGWGASGGGELPPAPPPPIDDLAVDASDLVASDLVASDPGESVLFDEAVLVEEPVAEWATESIFEDEAEEASDSYALDSADQPESSVPEEDVPAADAPTADEPAEMSNEELSEEPNEGPKDRD